MFNILLVILYTKIKALRMLSVNSSIRTGAILTYNNGFLGVFEVLIIKKSIKGRKRSSVPTLIQIPPIHIRNISKSYFIVIIATMESNNTQPIGIFFF